MYEIIGHLTFTHCIHCRASVLVLDSVKISRQELNFILIKKMVSRRYGHVNVRYGIQFNKTRIELI